MATRGSSPHINEILLVEDSEDEVTIALRALERRGYAERVRVLTNGEEALAFLDRLSAQPSLERVPRAIFLDLRMPGVDGKRVLQEIRRCPRTRHVPVVVVSSTQRASEIEECYRLGANSFISKRYGERTPGDYMAEAVRYWLDLNDVAS